MSKRKELLQRKKVQHINSGITEERKRDILISTDLSKTIKKGSYHDVVSYGSQLMSLKSLKMLKRDERRILARESQLEGRIPVLGSISSRDHHNKEYQNKVVWDVVCTYGQLLMREKEPPNRSRIEIRIELDLPIGLTKVEKRKLEEEADLSKLDVDKIEQMIANMSSILVEERFKVFKIDRSSRKKWFIEAGPTEEFTEMYTNQIYKLGYGDK
ncbi:unnamed protein product [Oikopleura dioica]|uniref:Uncharacterized protein n=1 Tax=Oikopleura dioica TaxID=34765 RepID=E4Z179_OIKDI|nr:unnamed protein product [Oikopleura dioica]